MTATALAELDHLLRCVAQQNAKLRFVIMTMVAMLVGGVVAVVLVAVSLSNLREHDLQSLAEGRLRTRIVAADNGLRGCRQDEDQNRVIASLVRASLRLLPSSDPRDATPGQRRRRTEVRKHFLDIARAYEQGRRCEQIAALKLLPARERRRLMALYPIGAMPKVQ